MITVVIPYYQKKNDILARALASIKAQEPCGMAVHVVVVDDASPVPAKGEVDSLGDLPFSIEVICQKNWIMRQRVRVTLLFWILTMNGIRATCNVPSQL